MSKRDFLYLTSLEIDELESVLSLAETLKSEPRGERTNTLRGRTVAIVMEKASTRTRVSFEVGVAQLGGHPVVIGTQGSQIGRGEPVIDTARVLARYCDAIVYRTYGTSKLLEMASCGVPVVNALTDDGHPVQVLADVITMRESLADRRTLADLERDARRAMRSLAHLTTAPTTAEHVVDEDAREAVEVAVDDTPLSFTVTGIIFTYALLRYRLLDIIPIARDVLIENMSDGVIVLDSQNRLVDFNPAALQSLRLEQPPQMGQPSSEIFAKWTDLVEDFTGVNDIRVELSFDLPARAFLDLKISPLYDDRANFLGRLIVWRDITPLKTRKLNCKNKPSATH